MLPRPPRALVVIGGSAGSLDPLRAILGQLPPAWGPAVVVALHVHRRGGGRLDALMSGWTALPVTPVEDKAPVLGGRVHLCPANYHTLVERGRTFALSTDAPVNHARPSIDVLFESAARTYGPLLAGVLLSGASADGAAGLAAIAAAGGMTLCQDPAGAIAPTMPAAGIARAPVDFVGPPDGLGLALRDLGAC